MLEFLTQQAQNHELKEKSLTQAARLNNADYQANNKYIVNKKTEVLNNQFANLYFYRLASIKKNVQEQAELKWADQKQKATYVDNILDLNVEERTVIIGTLFIEQGKKPSALKNEGKIIPIERFNLNQQDNAKFVDFDNDFAVLEDSSGRVSIKNNEVFQCSKFVTGSIIALQGMADKNGFFHVLDFCTAGVPYKASIPDSVTINHNQSRALFDSELLSGNDRQFVCFVSGLEFGGLTSLKAKESYRQLVSFLNGSHHNSDLSKLSSQICRLIIAGNSMCHPKDMDQVQRGSYKSAKLNADVYQDMNDISEKFELFLNGVLRNLSVDLMPGQLDFTNSLLPQQPINSFLLPGAAQQETLNLVTNPHSFNMNDIEFQGMSGQNLDDIRLYSDQKDQSPCDMLDMILQLNHLCPTAPDTIRTFPFLDVDPFIIEQAPDVLFAGNQQCFEQKIKYEKSSPQQCVKLLSIPSFKQTESIVLMDLKTLDAYEVKFQSNGQNETSSSQVNKANEDVEMQ